MSEMLALPPAENHTVIQGEVIDHGTAQADAASEAPVYNITSMGEAAPDAEQATMLTPETQEFEYITPDGQEGTFTPADKSAETENADATQSHEDARSYETYSNFSADLGYVAVAATSNYLRQPKAKTAETTKTPEQETPTASEIQDGITNDIIANVHAEDGEITALSQEQRYGIATRLYRVVESLPNGKAELAKIRGLLRNSDEALKQNGNLWGDEREWLGKLQETAERLLGGLPSFDNAELVKANVPQFYAYSEKNIRRQGKETWNLHGSVRGLDGMRRVIEFKKQEIRRKYSLAA